MDAITTTRFEVEWREEMRELGVPEDLLGTMWMAAELTAIAVERTTGDPIRDEVREDICDYIADRWKSKWTS